MRNIYRTIVRALGVFVIASGSTYAIAQPDIPVAAYKFRSQQGCALQVLYEFISTVTIPPARLLATEPGAVCRAGRAQGVWIFGTEAAASAGSQTSQLSVSAAAFENGSTKWMSIVFRPDRAFIYQLDIYGKWWPPMSAERIGRNDSVQTLQTRFDDVATRSGVPPAERAALWAAAQRWLSDPDKFVERYTADTGMAFVQSEKILLVDPVREAADRQRREQEAARQAEEQRRAAAAAREQQEFRAGLARMNPGQLFNRADQLQAAGDGARATEVRRTLIERFPNHALAATAAQQMAAPLQAGATAATGAARPASSGSGISCRDAMRRLQVAFDNAGDEDRFLNKSASTSSQVTEQGVWRTGYLARAVNQLPQCVNDATTRKYFVDDDAALRQNCPSRARGPANCSTGVNYYIDEGQVQAVFQQLMAQSASAAAPASPSNSADASCAARIAAVNRQFENAQQSIPANSVVVLSEATLWQLSESIAAVNILCPQSDTYRKLAAQLRETMTQTKRVCDASSSRGPCVARLPGVEPARAAAPIQSAEQRPAQATPPASCDGATGANWLSCQRQACARVSGVLESRGSCVSCNWAGGGFNRCAPGSGGVNSDR